MKRIVVLLFVAALAATLCAAQTTTNLKYSYEYVSTSLGDTGLKITANTATVDVSLIGFTVFFFVDGSPAPEIRYAFDYRRQGQDTVVYLWFGKMPVERIQFLMVGVTGFRAVENTFERVR